jgi:hypothetical protein
LNLRWIGSLGKLRHYPFFARAGRLEKRRVASLLDSITMGGDVQDIELLGSS